MIRIICGGKKTSGWALEAVSEYEKRLVAPFKARWEFYEEEKLAQFLERWPFSGNDFVVVADERGENLSSVELAQKLEQQFNHSRNIVIIIGGAYGVGKEARVRADLVWSFSRLVFPHMLFRVMMIEQIYRAQEINRGGKYHHL